VKKTNNLAKAAVATGAGAIIGGLLGGGKGVSDWRGSGSGRRSPVHRSWCTGSKGEFCVGIGVRNVREPASITILKRRGEVVWSFGEICATGTPARSGALRS
jgi:hypothetical protein